MYFQKLFLSEAYLKKGLGTRDREPRNQVLKTRTEKTNTPKTWTLKTSF